jgi:uncharacterized protein
MQTLIDLPSRWPKTVIAVVLGLTALAIGALIRPGLGMDPNPYPLNPRHPSMVAYHQLKNEYTGTLETALIHLRHPQTIYNPGTLERVAHLTAGLEQVTLIGPEDTAALQAFLPRLQGSARDTVASILADGITRADDVAITELQSQIEFGGEPAPGLGAALAELRLKLYPVRKVTSLANVEDIVAHGDELVVGKVYQAVPQDAAGLARIRAEVRGNRLFQRLLVSTDERSTGIQVETYLPETRSELMLVLEQRVESLLAQYPGPEETDIAGVPVMSATAVSTMKSDNSRLFPVVILLVLAILALTFRTFQGVLLPMGVVIISVVWTLALMAVLGVKLNIMTTALPVFLITIGVADGIHIISEFRDEYRRLGNRSAAVRNTMRQLALPVVMTSLTTFAGFISLAYTDISDIREFGIFVALGVLMAMVFSLAFIPAVLALGRRAPKAESARRGSRLLRRIDAAAVELLERVGVFAARQARWVLLAFAVAVAVGAYGMTRVVAENDFIRYFRPDMPIVASTKALDQHLAGSNAVNVLVSGPPGVDEPFKDPALLARVEGLQRDLEQMPFVGRTLSLADMLERINLVMHGNDPAFDRLPSDAAGIPGRNLTAQYLLLYENGGGSNLSDVTDSRFRTLNVRVTLTTRSTVDVQALQRRAQAYAAAHFPPGMTLRLAGSAELMTATNEAIVRGQIFSLGSSFVLILLLLLVEFRSLTKGLLGMVPLSVTAVLNFGAMGLFDIPLNIGTAIVSSIVIGIGVDFAIHYLSRLQAELPFSASLEEALQRTMHASGKAITANAVTVAVGFLALLMSDMIPMRYVGWMVCQTLLVSAVTTLMLLPAAVALLRPVFERNVATELVAEPQAA